MDERINWWKVALFALILIGLMTGSFFLGRKTSPVKEITKIEYVKGDVIRDTIDRPVPVKVVTPIDTADIIAQCVRDGIYTELFPTKTEYIEVTKEDTTKIMTDWASVRYYNETLFDSDTLGTCKVDAQVQYNRLKNLSYEFSPIIKTVTNTEYKVRYFTPFIGVGISTMPSVSGEMGFFINQSWGFSVSGDYYYNARQIVGMPTWSVGVKLLKEF